MRNRLNKIIAGVMAIGMISSFTACGNNTENVETTASTSEATTTEIGELTFTSAEEVETEESTTTSSMSAEEFLNGTESLYTVTDVENEEDRAIYKIKAVLPEGWTTNMNSSDGKVYASPNGTVTIKATNYGSNDELNTLAVFAESVAAGIVMNNMYYQADTEFGDPVSTTVAGCPAICYEYTVTSYTYIPDYEKIEEMQKEAETATETTTAATDSLGNEIKETIPYIKELYATYKDRLYVFYNDKKDSAYYIICESLTDSYDDCTADYDSIIESLTLSESGVEGMEEASVFMSEFDDYMATFTTVPVEESEIAETVETSE